MSVDLGVTRSHCGASWKINNNNKKNPNIFIKYEHKIGKKAVKHIMEMSRLSSVVIKSMD